MQEISLRRRILGDGRSKLWIPVLGAIVTIAISHSSAHALSDQYLCLVEASAGLHKDSSRGIWTSKEFGRSNKYIVRRLNDDDWNGKAKNLLEGSPKPNWAVFKFGDNALMAKCVENKEFVRLSAIDCKPIVFDASFDEDFRRFEITVNGSYISQGYWEKYKAENPEEYAQQLAVGKIPDVNKPDDLFFEIGTCSAF